MSTSSGEVDKVKPPGQRPAQPEPAAADTSGPEPLPIWFFVGLILLVYGVLVVIAGFVYTQSTTVLASTRPGLWWGAVIILAGALFLAIGLHVHRAARKLGGGP